MVDGEMCIDTTDTIFKLLNAERVDRSEIEEPESQEPPLQHNDGDVFSHSHASTLEPKRDWRCQPLRAHRRIVMTPIGFHIHHAQTQEELIIVLADAMRCHSSVHNHCGILHRDISENNILMVGGDKDAPVQGLLIDFDYSIPLDPENAGRRPGRSGTLPYMSIGNIENNDTQRTALDDWESLLYLICWTATIGLTSEKRSKIREIANDTKRSVLSKLPIHKWIDDDEEVIAYTKRTHMHSKDNFNSNILQHFHGEYDQLIFLAIELHEALFLHEGCEGAAALKQLPTRKHPVDRSNLISTPTTSPELYDPLPKRVQYEQAIVQNLEQVMSRYREMMIEGLR
ncbi:hypothetical protein H4R20_004416 [Coemansia guatemalensis]|uniref:Protein kinase domain-containing protein n=1 Tax=Coemansia guatemalensis TaxID=2761395 RepID=A0A9W8LST1_9FUNG|nr:hypothetical protein H4R20_004416 [Coemansia guatemalensis]